MSFSKIHKHHLLALSTAINIKTLPNISNITKRIDEQITIEFLITELGGVLCYTEERRLVAVSPNLVD